MALPLIPILPVIQTWCGRCCAARARRAARDAFRSELQQGLGFAFLELRLPFSKRCTFFPSSSRSPARPRPFSNKSRRCQWLVHRCVEDYLDAVLSNPPVAAVPLSLQVHGEDYGKGLGFRLCMRVCALAFQKTSEATWPTIAALRQPLAEYLA